MSAERLREAAAREREEWGGSLNTTLYPRSSAIHLALADWLDEVAGWREEGLGLIPYGNLGDAWACIERQANVVAAKILGGDR